MKVVKARKQKSQDAREIGRNQTRCRRRQPACIPEGTTRPSRRVYGCCSRGVLRGERYPAMDHREALASDQNGTVERPWRPLMNYTRCMMDDGTFPCSPWEVVFQTPVVCLANRLPTRANNECGIPHQANGTEKRPSCHTRSGRLIAKRQAHRLL